MNKGFVIMAQNTNVVDYEECAVVLLNSIKYVMPNANVTIITELPHGDMAPDSDWKLINDWQVYEASPYEYTIKLEADMIITQPIDYWWDVLKHKDVVVCNTIRNYKGDISYETFYRKFIHDNNLPNVYNAITYFKKSKFAEDFFKTVRHIFEHWAEFKKILKCNSNEIATTDWVYALACHIHDKDSTTMPMFTDMSMVHMKQFINNTISDDWTKELVYEFTYPIKIQTFPQLYPFHYHVKDFSKVLRENYG